jgi:hypothetical protein
MTLQSACSSADMYQSACIHCPGTQSPACMYAWRQWPQIGSLQQVVRVVGVVLEKEPVAKVAHGSILQDAEEKSDGSSHE